MIMAKPRLALLLAVTLATAGGCGSSPKRNFYTLQAPASHAARTAVGDSGQPAIVLGPVTVPDTVDRSQIVVRTSENRLDIRDLNRWAEPLRNEIARVLAADLSHNLGGAAVALQGQETAAGEPDLRLAVDVLRFESVLGDSATIEAAWLLRRSSGTPLRGRSSARERVSGPGYEALAAAHARALAKIAQDIAAVTREPGTVSPVGR